jgi:hypothetical protein
MAISKRPWGRIVAGVVATIVLLAAINLFFTSADMRQQFAAALASPELIHVEADCSKAGVYEGKFRHTFSAVYGLNFRIVTKPPLTASNDVKSTLAGLLGRVTIVSPDGATVYENTFRCEDFAYRRVDRDQWATATDMEYCPLRGRWNSLGSYTVKFAIDHGSAGLKDIPHAIVVAYQLDGVEPLGAFGACLFGIAGCTIAGILTLAVILITIRKHRKSITTPSAKEVIEHEMA